eukprot:GILI01005077.1.p1 GENE.GILI01005077.1~~GILI01005077.1.p1  ORF type:complete len:361 (+),score=121.06 GILI01005077.1:69-1085(+)
MSGRAVQLTQFGDVQTAQLKVVEVPIPSAKAGEVVVKMSVCPVNPADIFSIMGVYPGFQPASLPAVPGLEGMGVVHTVGEGVTSLRVGQRVVPFIVFGGNYLKSGNGSWQEYFVANAEDCFVIPDTVSDEAASQFVVNPFTAWLMLHELNVPQGEYFIQTAAGSVLGRQLIQMCKYKGIKSINIVRRAEQAEELKALGADYVIVQSEKIPDRVKEITNGKGAYGAVDCVGGDLTAEITGSLRDNGTILIYGAMSGLAFTGSIVDCLFRNVTVRGFWVTTEVNSLGIAKCQELAAQLWPLFTSGAVTPHSGDKYDVARVPEAIQHSVQEARGGKILITF